MHILLRNVWFGVEGTTSSNTAHRDPIAFQLQGLGHSTLSVMHSQPLLFVQQFSK